DEASRAALGAGAGIIERIGAAGDVAAEEELGAEERGGGGEEQVPHALVHPLVGLEGDVDLRAGIVEPDFPGVLNKLLVEVLLAREPKDGGPQVGVGNDR